MKLLMKRKPKKAVQGAFPCEISLDSVVAWPTSKKGLIKEF